MKIRILILALLFLVIFAGCVSEQGGETAPPQKQSDPAASYREYADAKNAAYDNTLTALIDEPDTFMQLEPKLMNAGTADMSVLPLVSADGKEETIKYLESLRFTVADVKRSGEEYTIYFKDPDGEDYVLNMTYDASLEAMQSAVTDAAGNEITFFEYIKTADGYTAQYYFGGTAQYNWITVYVSENISAFGISESGSKPESLLISAALGIDYVKKCETYFILEAKKLTIFDDGETMQI